MLKELLTVHCLQTSDNNKMSIKVEQAYATWDACQ